MLSNYLSKFSPCFLCLCNNCGTSSLRRQGDQCEGSPWLCQFCVHGRRYGSIGCTCLVHNVSHRYAGRLLPSCIPFFYQFFALLNLDLVGGHIFFARLFSSFLNFNVSFCPLVHELLVGGGECMRAELGRYSSIATN